MKRLFEKTDKMFIVNFIISVTILFSLSHARETKERQSVIHALHDCTGEKYKELLNATFFSKVIDLDNRSKNREMLTSVQYKNDWLAQAILLRLNSRYDYEAFSYLLKGNVEGVRNKNRKMPRRTFAPNLWKFLTRYLGEKKVTLWLLESVIKKNDLFEKEKAELIDFILSLYWPNKWRMKGMQKAGLSEDLMFSAMISLQKNGRFQSICKTYCDELSEEKRSRVERMRINRNKLVNPE